MNPLTCPLGTYHEERCYIGNRLYMLRATILCEGDRWEVHSWRIAMRLRRERRNRLEATVKEEK